jgi:hypothetical protein
MARLVAIVALFLLSITANASDNSIVGTWKFQSFVREVIATGERQNEFGEKPSGYISYQPDGRMFAMLVGDNRTKGLLENNLVTFSGASCSELLCSSIPHESREEIY